MALRASGAYPTMRVFLMSNTSRVFRIEVWLSVTACGLDTHPALSRLRASSFRLHLKMERDLGLLN